MIAAASAAAEGCDLFLAIGTSLTVQPAALLPGMALRAGARLVIANAQPTTHDDRADAVLRGSIGKMLPRLVGTAADP